MINKLTNTNNKTKLKVLVAVGVAAAALTLAGCSSSSGVSNLLSAKPQVAAKYVYQAWVYGVEKSGVNVSYTKCAEYPSTLDNPFTGAKGSATCKKLFDAMADYKATDKDLTQFNGTKAKAFTSKKLAKQIGNMYDNYQATDGQSATLSAPGLYQAAISSVSS